MKVPTYFDEWYGGKKPRRIDFNLSVSPDCMMAVGFIALQWAALGSTLQFQINFKSRFDGVPSNLGSATVRREAKYQIQHLRALGPHLYKGSRDTAAKEFDAILSDIDRLKGVRDKLVHGTYSENDNRDPNELTVHYKGRKSTMKLAYLHKVAVEIGQANAALMQFDQWANYHQARAQLAAFPGPDPQP